MKNRFIICSILLMLIIILSTLAVCYYNIKLDITSEELSSSNNLSNSQSNNIDNEDYITTITKFSDVEKYLLREKNSFFVFGKKSCHYCTLYTPVLNNVAKKYNIEIFYVDLGSMSEDDFYNTLNYPLEIPAKCTKDGVSAELKSGFGTPLSLFVNNGVTYDCIRGYKDYTTLVELLRENGYIK